MDENRHDQPQPSDPESVHLGHERTDVDTWAVGKFAIGLVLLCIATIAILFGLFHYFLAREIARNPVPPAQGLNVDARKRPPQPELEETPIQDLRRMRETEDTFLTTYGWVDQRNGIVRIPIDRAIDLLAQRGLPARPSPPPSPVANVTVPTESSLGPKVQQPGGPLASELSTPAAEEQKK